MTRKLLRSIRVFALVLFTACATIGVGQDLAVNYEAKVINPGQQTLRSLQALDFEQLSRQLEKLSQRIDQGSTRLIDQRRTLAETDTAHSASPPPTIPEAELFSALSTYRQAHQKSPLVKEDSLCVYARARLDEHHRRLSSLGPDDSPLDDHGGFQRDAESGYVFELTNMKAVAENLAYLPEYATATQIIEWGWDSSSGHRDAQLSNDWTHACISGEYPFYVGIFGRR